MLRRNGNSRQKLVNVTFVAFACDLGAIIQKDLEEQFCHSAPFVMLVSRIFTSTLKSLLSPHLSETTMKGAYGGT